MGFARFNRHFITGNKFKCNLLVAFTGFRLEEIPHVGFPAESEPELAGSPCFPPGSERKLHLQAALREQSAHSPSVPPALLLPSGYLQEDSAAGQRSAEPYKGRRLSRFQSLPFADCKGFWQLKVPSRFPRCGGRSLRAQIAP